MKIIVAAFEPFDGRKRNRSERAAARLRDDVDVRVTTLPVSFTRLPLALDAILDGKPDVLLLVGESKKVRVLTIERFAVNLADARVPDNDGHQPRGVALDPNGPAARASDLRALDATFSAHAGTFCCNAALYYALGRAGGTRVVFAHVPARKRHLRARDAAAGLRQILRALI